MGIHDRASRRPRARSCESSASRRRTSSRCWTRSPRTPPESVGRARGAAHEVRVGEDGNPVLTPGHIDADKPLRHGTSFARRQGPARLSRTGATGRDVSMAWSNVRDGGEPSPSILDECFRPGGWGVTFSVDGCSRRSAEVPGHQSSFPSYLRTDFNRPLLLPTRGTATTLASTVRS